MSTWFVVQLDYKQEGCKGIQDYREKECKIHSHVPTMTAVASVSALRNLASIDSTMIYKQRRAIATNHDSSSQCICTQEDTGAELNIEEQHWISTGIFSNICSGNSYIHCHCRETSNTARRCHDVNNYLWIVINKENAVAINIHTTLQVTVKCPLFNKTPVNNCCNY